MICKYFAVCFFPPESEQRFKKLNAKEKKKVQSKKKVSVLLNLLNTSSHSQFLLLTAQDTHRAASSLTTRWRFSPLDVSFSLLTHSHAHTRPR